MDGDGKIFWLAQILFVPTHVPRICWCYLLCSTSFLEPKLEYQPKGPGPGLLGFSILPKFLHTRRKRIQTSDKMDKRKSRGGKSQWRERKKEEDQRRETKKREDQRRETRQKEDAGAQKGRKVAKHCVFPKFGVSGGEKIGSVKGEGAKPSGGMRDQKLQAAVARSAFRSQNATNITCWSEHFEDQTSNKCMPLWCEGRSEGKT